MLHLMKLQRFGPMMEADVSITETRACRGDSNGKAGHEITQQPAQFLTDSRLSSEQAWP